MLFSVHSGKGNYCLDLVPDNVYVVGYSGRNIHQVQKHIKELQELGIQPPPQIPMIYACSVDSLSQESAICCAGQRTSGEAEYVIIWANGKVYIGLGSDHTDRDLERTSILAAKRSCGKPIASTLWEYDEVKSHWDHLRISSQQTVDGNEILYQDGSVESILPVETILQHVLSNADRNETCVIFSGTVPLLNGFSFGSDFQCRLFDPVCDRSIEMRYSILPCGKNEI